jgi:hypothetical protein
MTRGSALTAALGVAIGLGCNGADDGAGEPSGSTGINVSTTSMDPQSSTESGTTASESSGMGPFSDSGCADVEVTVEPETPTIVLLIDQSGSMDENFGGTPKWEAVYETLMDPDDGVIRPLESTIRFGLTLYTGPTEDDEDRICPQLTEVPPALDNFDAMDAVFAAEGPADETPTGESLAEVAVTLDAFDEPGPKAIVLATDGEPDTCAQPNPQQGQPEALEAAQSTFDLGIETFILSVGDDVGEEHLQEMANAGIGLDPQGPMDAPFWVALDAQELADAFAEIVGGFVGCSFELNGIVTLDDYCEGTVLLDGMPLSCPEEWHMLDDHTIELLGQACETLQDGQSHTVSADFPCGGVAIP